MIRGESVRFQRDEVVVKAVFEFEPAEDDVVERGYAVLGHAEADGGARAAGVEGGAAGRRNVAAMPVVADDFIPARLPLAADCLQAVRRAVAGIGEAGGDESVDFGAVDVQPLGLDVRGAGSSDVGSFVPVEPNPAQGFKHGLDRAFGLAPLVGVLHADDERAAALPRVKPRENGGADVADVRVARRAWGETEYGLGFHGVDFSVG